VYPFHGSLGVELDVFHSTPHVKNLDDIPGIHLAVTMSARIFCCGTPVRLFSLYRRRTRHSDCASQSFAYTEQDTQVSIGFNLITGIRAFVTPIVALFTEYKFTDGGRC
jgi:hypothetical protein